MKGYFLQYGGTHGSSLRGSCKWGRGTLCRGTLYSMGVLMVVVCGVLVSRAGVLCIVWGYSR